MATATRLASSAHSRTACQPSTSGRHLLYAPPSSCRRLPARRLSHHIRAAAGGDYMSERRADEEYMKEYQGLKDQLMDNTRKSGAVVAAYLLLTVDGQAIENAFQTHYPLIQAALCTLLGTAASYAYLSWLYRDVDSYTADTVVPMMEAEKVEPGWCVGRREETCGRIENTLLRRLAKLGCAYRQALQPRLLVPVALAAGCAAYNRLVGPEASLDTLHQGCLLGGFLAYKLALVVKVADDLTPKTYADAAESRPRVEPIEDELDMFGRPKRRTVRMPTEALPEGAEPEKMPLAGLILAAEGSEAAAEGESAGKQVLEPRR
ncbi:hypothetical protein GPECTOR_36g71 [Gonium pectorale]|uniref:Uncharacterized protein n=1 Tax=Gonium pectorale TaxID=33097 RepID=A0A150GBY8_GONPE|nr:hypothetical protein GPECTOR_36g71 [Gonium pectorale]|eukprot:KXZ47348.1 hypothetical protein GPECTOR_36g71 [Gonium pectorale]